MIKKLLASIGAFLVVLLSLGAVKVAQIKAASSQQHIQPPAAVTSFAARLETWQPVLGAIATLAPVQGVFLGAESSGAITRVAVENGASVRAGDLLLQIDDAIERAQLAAADARLAIAKIDVDRAAELSAKATISQAELDAATAQFNQARADWMALRAVVDKKSVRAPFAGRVGIRQVNVGQYVTPGTPLLPLQSMDPMFVNFNLPQRHLPVIELGQAVAVKVDAFPDQVFEGRVTAINPEVDAASRNVSLQATISNPGEKLRAGMFARVELQLPSAAPSVVIPATAVAYAPYGNSEFVLEQIKGPDGKEYLGAAQRFVKLGVSKGDLVEVLDGLKPGEVVASVGVFKLRNGAPVLINNQVQPSAEVAPKPVNS
jgi:membrane fusion protein (multidrug efflux system)